jgi:hypothetical protein
VNAIVGTYEPPAGDECWQGHPLASGTGAAAFLVWDDTTTDDGEGADCDPAQSCGLHLAGAVPASGVHLEAAVADVEPHVAGARFLTGHHDGGGWIVVVSLADSGDNMLFLYGHPAFATPAEAAAWGRQHIEPHGNHWAVAPVGRRDEGQHPPHGPISDQDRHAAATMRRLLAAIPEGGLLADSVVDTALDAGLLWGCGHPDGEHYNHLDLDVCPDCGRRRGAPEEAEPSV